MKKHELSGLFSLVFHLTDFRGAHPPRKSSWEELVELPEYG
jgi:hypothetical protein